MTWKKSENVSVAATGTRMQKPGRGSDKQPAKQWLPVEAGVSRVLYNRATSRIGNIAGDVTGRLLAD